MKISFLDFWPRFDPKNNFFIEIIKQIKENVTVTEPENAELIIFSCFGHKHKNYKNIKRVFFIGENKRPTFKDCEYSLSYDFDSYGNKNFRLPLWYLYIDWFNSKLPVSPDYLIPLSFLDNLNKFSLTEKTKFCVAVFGKKRQNRFDSINTINTYKEVDCYGKIFNKQIPRGEYSKLDTIKRFKFHQCFENSIYPGYFTEKLLHAKIAGTVPLYWADISLAEDFNSQCCLNLLNYSCLNSFLEHIKEIDTNSVLYNKIIKEPLFNKSPNLDLIKSYFTELLQN